jgi:predicted Zn finger-like uncharacterized protein
MILTCPQCETRYNADASKFAPPGRKVRCAKCGHVWHQEADVWHQEAPVPEPGTVAETVAPPPETRTPPAPTPAVQAAIGELEPQRTAYAPAAERVPPTPPPTVSEKKPRAPSRLPRQIGMTAGWLALVAVILVIGWSAVSYRQQIATVWPQASSVYAALGMHVNTRGLDFVDVAYHHETEDGQPVLAISGKLVNVSQHDVPVPAIEVSLSDDSKHVLYHWNFNSSVATLRPGQTVAFLTRLSSPPSAARHLELRFAEAGG